jgi:hypothetical protein
MARTRPNPHEFGSKEHLYREAVDYYLKVSSSYLRGFSNHRDTRAAFEALIEEGAAFFTNDASPAGWRFAESLCELGLQDLLERGK